MLHIDIDHNGLHAAWCSVSGQVIQHLSTQVTCLRMAAGHVHHAIAKIIKLERVCQLGCYHTDNVC
jgi:hypothetical protein